MGQHRYSQRQIEKHRQHEPEASFLSAAKRREELEQLSFEDQEEDDHEQHSTTYTD